MQTYSFAKRGVGSLTREMLALYRSQSCNFQGQVEFLPLCMEQCEDRVRARAGIELRELRAGGELAEYSDQELMTVNLVAQWQKPRDSRSNSISRSAPRPLS